MRNILKKLDRSGPLNNTEYHLLMEYVEELRRESPESYTVFHDRYADILLEDYAIRLPRFAVDMDEFMNFLQLNPQLISQWEDNLAVFPTPMQPFLHHLKNSPDFRFKRWLGELLQNNNPREFPLPREKDIVIKYEDGNPLKETGIKSHFDRLSRYPFISRLQTYRHLNAKAIEDRIEYLSPDMLGGIYTNKEKSIYYYIFLTEPNEEKAKYACDFLNNVLYK